MYDPSLDGFAGEDDPDIMINDHRVVTLRTQSAGDTRDLKAFQTPGHRVIRFRLDEIDDLVHEIERLGLRLQYKRVRRWHAGLWGRSVTQPRC